MEDDPQLGPALLTTMQARQYGVDSAAGGTTALAAAEAWRADRTRRRAAGRLRAVVRRTEAVPLPAETTVVTTDEFTIDPLAKSEQDVTSRRIRRQERVKVARVAVARWGWQKDSGLVDAASRRPRAGGLMGNGPLLASVR
ncbi:hypothetical protein [Streptomyces sp. NBC_00286]|uniref:hypothetical protein n=1 Tax=Streptomyces sp. NBC_00286 TaxID=2975701 RepID=UPI002E293C85|nr:hypothetical protein [Streptomyces sp. NBC_00286]